MNRPVCQLRLVVFFVVLACIVSPAQAMGEPPVPVDVQIPIFFKIMTYDRNLSSRAEGLIRIAVIYDESDSEAVEQTAKVISTIAGIADKTVKGIPFRWQLMELGRLRQNPKVLEECWINTVFMVGGRAEDVQVIGRLAAEQKIPTFATSAHHVRAGLAIGVGVENDRPKIIVNLRQARAEGMALDANLLRLCKVIR